VFWTISLACGSLHAQCGNEPTAAYSLMNATKDRIWVDIDSPNNRDWREMPLYSSQSATFAGALERVKVRLKSGRVLHYDKHRIAAIRTQARLQKGDWLIDSSGLHFVSCEEREKIFQAVKKYEWPKS
jgi:hypothetical protein